MVDAFIVIVTIFWMVVGWRAMKAHERIADAAGEVVRGPVQFFQEKDQ
jgi:uncharacterized membrane protein